MASQTPPAPPAPSASPQRDAPGAAAGADPSPAGQAGLSRQPPPPPPRVRRPTAASRIRAIADVATTLNLRESLRRLADRVRKGAGNAQRAEFVEAAIGECLDEAVTAGPSDRWLACEAATWALAWMARARRAGGSAGGLLERLVGEARSTEPLLADGDTSPARFVLTLARLFRDIEACSRLEPAATGAMAAEIERLVTPAGGVQLAGSAATVDRVVRWTSFRETATGTGSPAWDEVTDRRWRKAAGHALRLLGDGGRRIAGSGLMPARFTTVLLEAFKPLDTRRRRTVKAVRSGRLPQGRGARLLPRDWHDEDAAIAVMRSDWGRGAVRVLVDYRHPTPRLEIAVGDRLVLDGPWQWNVSVAGTPIESEGPWSADCWEAGAQASFLEISAPLPGGLRFERQIAMLPRERVVLLADAITGSSPTPPATAAGRGETNGHATAPGARGPQLRYAASLPLGPGLEADPAEETREVLVFDTRMRMMALPLALPEWRVGQGGKLEPAAGGLSLSQESGGSRLYAPLWLDFDPARIGRPLTWRQLTVADTRVNLPPWQAAGFRVQAGLEQWLVYRALDEARNRTLLGCNLSSEFFLGRIRKQGAVKRILEIQ
jgi:hypothetical protein